MIDTIRLNLGSPVVRTRNNLIITPPSTSRGVQVGYCFVVHFDDGTNQYCSSVRYQDTLIRINSYKGNMMLQTSISRISTRGDNNIWPVTKTQAGDCLSYLYDYLEQEVGLIIDPIDCTISRLDIFNNADCKYPFSDYRASLLNLSFPKMRRIDEGSSILFKNSNRQIAFYSKYDEQYSKSFNTTNLPPNLVRCELRFMNSHTCRKLVALPDNVPLNLNTLISNWDILCKHYDRTVLSFLNGFEDNASTASFSSVRNQLTILEDKCGSKSFRYLVEMLGIVSLIKCLGGTYNLHLLLDDLGHCKQRLYREKLYVKNRQSMIPTLCMEESGNIMNDFINKLTYNNSEKAY